MYEIKFIKGDDHVVEYEVEGFDQIEKAYLTVKCVERIARIKKNIKDGIKIMGNIIQVTFTPEDTNDIPWHLDMIYDLEVISEGKKRTIIKDKFTLEEDITTPEDEGDA